MALPRFLSVESGLRLLQATLRSFVATSKHAPAFSGRIHHTLLGSGEPKDLTLQAAFLRLVSVTEATVDSLGMELTSRDLPNVDDVIRLLMLEKELSASSNWPSRPKAFKRHPQYRPRKCAEHARLEGAI